MSAAYDLNDNLAGDVSPLPHNLVAEMALLGAVLREPRDALPIARGLVSPGDFFEALNGRIFAAMLDIDREGMTPGLQALISALRDDTPVSDDMPVGAYLARVAAQATTIINVSDYARLVRNLSVARQTLGVADGIYEALQGEGALKPFAAVSEAVAQCDDLLASKDRSGGVETDLAGAIGVALEQAEFRKDQRGEPEITTGLADLNRVLGGLWRGQLVVVAGRPAMGKSAFMGALMANTARAGHGSATFSYEMGHGELGVRAAALMASEHYSADRLEYSEFRRGVFSERQRDLVERAGHDARNLPVRIISASGMTVHDIASRARRIATDMERRGQRLDVIFVDYLQRITASNRYAGSRVQEIGEVTTALKTLAQQMGVCVVLLSQLSRAVEARNDKRPMLSDLRESGDIEQDADVVMFLYRDAYYLEKDADPSAEAIEKLERCRNVVEIGIAKQRSGPTATVKVFGDLATNVFRDLGGER